MGTAYRGGAADALISGDDGRKYWAGVNADVSGMLGGTPEMGLPFLSRVDMQGSRNFLAKLKIGTKAGQRTVDSALEGGAGYVNSSPRGQEALARARLSRLLYLRDLETDIGPRCAGCVGSGG